MRKNSVYSCLLFFSTIVFFVVTPNLCFAEKKTAHVNLFIGTAGDNGQVDPAACIPYGMVRVCPDSDPRSHVGYDYEIAKISGFSVNRVSGIGCGGAGGIISVKPSKKSTTLSINKDYESASPGYYTAMLDNGVKAELTATNNVAIEKYHFPKGEEAFMFINFAASFTKILDVNYEIVSDKEIRGYVHAGNTCDHGAYKLYFSLTTSKPFNAISKNERDVELSFGNKGKNSVEVRVALSSIDKETARKENDAVKKQTLEQIKKQAANAWEKVLSRIDIGTKNNEEKTLFYTSLYRTFLSPAKVTSIDGRYLGTDGIVREKEDFTYYGCWSIWDTYRTKFPLITLLDAESMRNFSNSLCKLFVNGKADWATPFESTPTVRTEHSIVVILDAYRKGIPGIHLEEAYEGMKKEMDNLPTNRPDQTMETCMDWWAMAQIAEILGKTDDAEYYSTKSKNMFKETWNKDFKNIDDSFARMRDNGLYQGTRWQYRWALPQYLDYMIESVGKEDLSRQLNYYFDNNLFNQSNEVGLHAPYIFNLLGEYSKTQKNVRRMIGDDIKHLYGGNAEYPTPYVGKAFKVGVKGFMPEMDEDDGAMGGWYVLSTIGLFPLMIGEPWYEITSPFFDNIKITLDNGVAIQIKTVNRKSPDDLIKQIKFNNNLISDFKINHNELVKGGILEIEY